MFNTTYPAVTPKRCLSHFGRSGQSESDLIPVSRVVAKAAVVKALLSSSTAVDYAKYHLWLEKYKPTLLFYPKIDGGIIKDYNWDSYNVNDFVRGTDQIPVNEATATPTTFSYTLENSFNYIPRKFVGRPNHLLSIQGQFLPDQICRIKTGVTAPRERQTSNSSITRMVTGRFMSYVPTMVAVTISLPAQMQKNMPNYVLPMLRICRHLPEVIP
ncbi:MAG: hypothetical protein ACLUOS_03820 [Odoribacter splanchnicus]